MRILLVEDEPSISQFIRQGLTEAGYAIDVLADGRDGLDYALSVDYDVLVIDIMVPRLNGLQLVRELREQGIKTPALLLTARDGVDDRVKGLDVGADDYLVKPFAFPELLARIRALLRRPPLQTARTSICTCDNSSKPGRSRRPKRPSPHRSPPCSTSVCRGHDLCPSSTCCRSRRNGL